MTIIINFFHNLQTDLKHLFKNYLIIKSMTHYSLSLRTIVSILYLLFQLSLFSQSNESPKYEMRGLWVATVNNIDWPSKPGLSIFDQKKEALAILDRAVSLHLNTIFFQVRSMADAFYESKREPWSAYLMGESGQNPGYDPLAFWVMEAHARGLDIHAWINPFRASMSLTEPLALSHPLHQYPNWFIIYGNKYLFDPGLPECRQYIADIVSDIVSKYNIDGIHLDDYFYPYPLKGELFNDQESFEKYGKAYAFISLEEWRRSNVDATVALIHQTIKSINPNIVFGISPFGVWRNNNIDSLGSDTRAGITNYDNLYADVLKWMKEKQVDYIIPQIYWDTNHPTANFIKIIKWWSDNNNGIPIYVGHSLYRVNKDPAPWNNPSQILDQIRLTRSTINIGGSVFFNANHFNRNLLGVQDSLKKDLYKYFSLLKPINKEFEKSMPQTIQIVKRCKKLKWRSTVSDSLKRYIIYRIEENDSLISSKNIIAFTTDTKYQLTKSTTSKNCFYIVTSQNQNNTEQAISNKIKSKY